MATFDYRRVPFTSNIFKLQGILMLLQSWSTRDPSHIHFCNGELLGETDEFSIDPCKPASRCGWLCLGVCLRKRHQPWLQGTQVLLWRCWNSSESRVWLFHRQLAEAGVLWYDREVFSGAGGGRIHPCARISWSTSWRGNRKHSRGLAALWGCHAPVADFRAWQWLLEDAVHFVGLLPFGLLGEQGSQASVSQCAGTSRLLRCGPIGSRLWCRLWARHQLHLQVGDWTAMAALTCAVRPPTRSEGSNCGPLGCAESGLEVQLCDSQEASASSHQRRAGEVFWLPEKAAVEIGAPSSNSPPDGSDCRKP